jgi:hypothetical protein
MKTDSQLQQDVMAELKWEPAVHAAQIGVEVKDGVVTLAGEVASYAEKLGAERAALRVGGVKALAVEMKVKLSDFGKRSDGDVARSAENVLSWSSSLPKGFIRLFWGLIYAIAHSFREVGDGQQGALHGGAWDSVAMDG